MKRLLHVGCGPKYKGGTTPVFNTPDWDEVRLDIDPAVSPDIVASITDLSVVETGSFDAVYSSHNIEHLPAHDVVKALKEFRRVLAPGGHFLVRCPDLKAAARLIVEDKLVAPAYVSGKGPVSPLDILYGFRRAMMSGNDFMAHRCGFTLKVLLATLRGVGFEGVVGVERPRDFELWALATRDPASFDTASDLLRAHMKALARAPKKAAIAS